MAKLRSVADYLSDNEMSKEVDRIAELVYMDSKGKIIDRDTFEQYFYDWIEIPAGQGEPSHRQRTLLGNAVFDTMREQHPEQISDKRLFSREVEKRKKLTPTEKREPVVDGYKEGDYAYVGQSGNRVAVARLTYVEVRGKRVRRFRGKDGRFVSIKKPERVI